ncbi:uncharacterized protein [Onthophagus taurus]|uniref:uncharacterized protein n=1 Tax=Onthophagus taurus TaxID=166361 RepID=UPI0039BE1521
MSSKVLIVYLLTSFSAVHSGWIEDLKGIDGLNIGDSGIKLFLDEDDDVLGRSDLEKYSLRMGYSGLGLSVGKKDSKLDVGIYYNDGVEGRGKKMGQLIIPVLMGMKATAIGSLMMAAVGGLVLKSLMFAKLALVTSSLLGLYKLYGNKSSGGGHIQTTHQSLPPTYTNNNNNIEYQQMQPTDIYSHIAPTGYANYPTSLQEAASNQAQQLAVVNPGEPINATHQIVNLSPHHFGLNRRHSQSKRYRNKK